MLRILLALALGLLTFSPASAGLYRVDVTGSAAGLWYYNQSFDLADDSAPKGGGALDFNDVPGDFWGKSVAKATSGSLLYGADGGFSECTGLLALACQMAIAPGKTAAFDAVQDTFAAEFFASCCAGMTLGTSGFTFGHDGGGTLTIGTMQYVSSGLGVSIKGVFDQAEVSVVPLPAAVPLLLCALGSLMVFRRRGRAAA